MVERTRRAVQVGLLVGVAVTGTRAMWWLPSLGTAVGEAACPVPVERVGEGVGCWAVERDGVRAGDVIADALDGAAGSGEGPGRPVRVVGRMTAARLELLSVPVDLNDGSLEELGSLPGLGARMAERIAAARPFATVEDLRRVPGIGRRRLAALRPRLRLDGGSP